MQKSVSHARNMWACDDVCLLTPPNFDTYPNFLVGHKARGWVTFRMVWIQYVSGSMVIRWSTCLQFQLDENASSQWFIIKVGLL